MAIKKHGARVNTTPRKDIKAGRATGRAYIVTDTDGQPAYVVMPDGTIDRFNWRTGAERRAFMFVWVQAFNAQLDEIEMLEGGN